jgi:hypothetical protein
MDYTYRLNGTYARIINVKTGAEIRQLSGRGQEIENVIISGDTASVVTESRTYVYDLKSGACIRSI